MFVRSSRALVFASLLGAACVAGPASARPAMSAARSETATVRLHDTAVAFGAGLQWGGGEMTYRGRTHHFDIQGLSIVDIGVAKVHATGVATHIATLSDFTGVYAAASGGVDVGTAGSGTTLLKNEHGVELRLKTTGKGLRFNFSADGVHIRLKD